MKKHAKQPHKPPQIHPSPEQQLVCDFMKAGENVVVDACAGSGKSTTILSVAKALNTKKILQITYNAMLRKEFKEKVKEHALDNIDVHTYHSFAVKYFSDQAHTDTGIRHVLNEKRVKMGVEPESETAKLPKYDVIVLDETQDMTLLFFRLIHYILGFICPRGAKGRPHKVQLLILGDYMQGLYEFKGADIRFLTLAHELWRGGIFLKSPHFQRCSLKTSYRITKPMASFVNHVMLGCPDDAPRLVACRDGGAVIYIRNSRTNIEKIVVYHIQKILEEGDLPSDIFILGASVKGANSNVRRMENALVEKGIPCHVPMMEEGGIDERVINGKVVFSTYHQSKGRQRKYVFLVGFDHSYFAYYAKNLPEDHCPNTLYVGCTRATHRMFLLENNDRPTDQPLRFLKMNHYEMKDQEYIDFKGHPQVLFYEKDPQLAAEEAASAARKRPVHFVTPTDLIKFIPESVLEEITPLVERIFKPVTVTGLPELTAEDIPTIVAFPSSGLYEDVADLNGIALPCMFWDRLNHDNINVLYSLIEGMLADTGDNEHLFLKRRFREVDPTNHTPANYLYLANLYLAVQEKLYFKLCQIAKEEYNWLSETVVDRCRRRLDLVVGCETIIDHEYTFIHPKMEMEHRPIDELLDHHLVGGQGTAVTPLSTPKYRFSARLDLVTQSSIWEIKCTHQITIDHMLQVVIYAWLWRLVPGYDAKKNAKIFNLKTGEVFVLDATTEELTKIVVELLRGKYEKHEPLSDDDFLTLCRTTVSF